MRVEPLTALDTLEHELVVPPERVARIVDPEDSDHLDRHVEVVVDLAGELEASAELEPETRRHGLRDRDGNVATGRDGRLLRPRALDERCVLGQAVGMAKHGQRPDLARRRVGHGEGVRPRRLEDLAADLAEDASQRLHHDGVDRGGLVRRDAGRDGDVRGFDRLVGQDPVQAGNRDGVRIHGSGREQGRRQQADQSGRDHDRPIGS